MKQIAIIGAGGFGQEVYCIWRDVLQSQGVDYKFIGFFDDDPTIKENIYAKVMGNVEDLNNLKYPTEVGIAVGNVLHIKDIRKRISNEKVSFPNIIHPSVVFLDKTTTALGIGNIFSVGVIISCNVNVGSFNIFNTRSTLGHDDKVGDFNVFSPNVQISGNVTIENQNFFGFNSGVIQGKKIGNLNTLGAGAILLRTIKDSGTFIGVPAKKFNM
ncbi:serine acetyltransferase [Limibacterium fermenti]|mgnify:CR=1 FL=1|uniref:PglD-related sugar-binding protein n=1 Tax=Limibacterium fermenti TaxID=3229863 RepID=UPI003A71ABEB